MSGTDGGHTVDFRALVEDGIRLVGRTEDGREALVAAVVQVVGRDGLVGLTNRKVGKEAGVDNSLITYYFGSREGLLAAATEWATGRSLDLANAASTARLDATFAEAVVNLVLTEPELQLFQFEMILASRRQAELRPTVARLYDSYIESFQKMLVLYGYPGNRPLARAVFSSVESLILQQLTVADPTEIKDAIADPRWPAAPRGGLQRRIGIAASNRTRPLIFQRKEKASRT